MRISHFKGLSILLILALSLCAPMPGVKAGTVYNGPTNQVRNNWYESDLVPTWYEDNATSADLRDGGPGVCFGHYMLKLEDGNAVYQEFDPVIEVDLVTQAYFYYNTWMSESYGVLEVYYNDTTMVSIPFGSNSGGNFECPQFDDDMASGKFIEKIAFAGTDSDPIWVDGVYINADYFLVDGEYPWEMVLNRGFEWNTQNRWIIDSLGVDCRGGEYGVEGASAVTLNDTQALYQNFNGIPVDKIVKASFWAMAPSSGLDVYHVTYVMDDASELLISGTFYSNLDWTEIDILDEIQGVDPAREIVQILLQCPSGDDLVYDDFTIRCYSEDNTVGSDFIENGGFENVDNSTWGWLEPENFYERIEDYVHYGDYCGQFYSCGAYQNFSSIAVDDVYEFSLWYRGGGAGPGGNTQYVVNIVYNDTTNTWIDETVSCDTIYYPLVLTEELDAGKFITSIELWGYDENPVFYDDVILIYMGEEGEEPPPPEEQYIYTVNLRRWENGTVYNEPYYASIIEEDGYLHSELIEADDTVVSYNSTIFAFTYPLYDEDEFRTLYSPESPITPVIPGALNDQYLFTIKDLTGYLNGKTSTLEVWKNVNGEDVIVDSALVTNTVNGIPLRLTRYALVTLKLLLPNAERYDFGTFMPTGNPLAVTLVFNYSDLDDSINHFNQYVSASAERSLDYETITVEVTNTLTIGYDFTSEATLYMRNGTVVDSQSSTDDSETFTFANLTASQDYIVMLQLTHSFFPGKTFKASWTFAGSWSPGNDEPFPDFSDLGWTFGGVTQIIGVILVLITAGLFSYVSAPVGIMFTILVAGMLGQLGILTVTSGTLASVFSLGMILIFGRRNNG